MRIGLFFAACILAGCGTLLSGYTQYCEEYIDCLDGNKEDERACVIDFNESERIAKVYGCKDDFNDYMGCMKEEADCESMGRTDYWTADDDCEDEYEDYLDCLSDESDLLGGGYDDTGSWGGYERDEVTEPTFNIAWTDDGNTLEASVSNAHLDGYFLGLAETGSGAEGWYGEDCISDDAICHDMGADSSLALTGVSSIPEVVAGSTTLFNSGLWAGVTCAFFSNEGDTNYETLANVGGDDASYYE